MVRRFTDSLIVDPRTTLRMRSGGQPRLNSIIYNGHRLMGEWQKKNQHREREVRNQVTCRDVTGHRSGKEFCANPFESRLYFEPVDRSFETAMYQLTTELTERTSGPRRQLVRGMRMQIVIIVPNPTAVRSTDTVSTAIDETIHAWISTPTAMD